MWNQTYGGNGSQVAYQIVNTTGNEHILIGSAIPSDSFDGWVAQIDASGEEQWNRSYGTEETDSLRDGVQTDDGYLLVGRTGSIEGESDPDAWLLKIDNSGHEKWNTSYGGEKGDGFVSIVPTDDNGYLLGGNTCSVGTDCTAWVIKVDASGTEVWNRTIGQGYTRAYDVIGTRDGGFLLTGVAAAGQYNFEGWAAKLNATGYEQWNQTYGGGPFEDSVQTRDGGYALTGSRRSTGNASDADMWLVKLTETGRQEWQQTYGWQENDKARSVVQTADGGFAVAGSMIPPEMSGLTTEFGVVKTDESGSEQWRWTDGTPWGTVPGVDERNLRDDAYSITFTSDGDYIVAGQAQRPDDDEAWAVRFSSERDTPNRSTWSLWKRPSYDQPGDQ